MNFPNFSMWIVLSIACILIFSKILGAIGLIFIIEGNNAYKAGNYQKFENSKRNAAISLGVGVVIGCMYIAATVFFSLLNW